MVIAAVGTWYGGWVDELIQRITEINLVLPFLSILIMIGTFYSRSIWVILGATILLSIFTGAIKGYRSIFVQVKESMYIEAARAYGASSPRIVFLYLIPRMIPLLIPGLVSSVPAFVFLEASLALLGLGDPVLPTWGKIIEDANSNGALISRLLLLDPGTGNPADDHRSRVCHARVCARPRLQSKTEGCMTTPTNPTPQKLLKIEDLVLHFKTRAGTVQAVDGVDFELDSNRAVVILGESGCGKSSLAKAILRLLPRNVERYSGEVYLQGTDVMKFDEEQFRQNVRWAEISLVPQAAMNALNPVIKVGDQVAEPAMVHLGIKKEEALGLGETHVPACGRAGGFSEPLPV